MTNNGFDEKHIIDMLNIEMKSDWMTTVDRGRSSRGNKEWTKQTLISDNIKRTIQMPMAYDNKKEVSSLSAKRI